MKKKLFLRAKNSLFAKEFEIFGKINFDDKIFFVKIFFNEKITISQWKTTNNHYSMKNDHFSKNFSM